MRPKAHRLRPASVVLVVIAAACIVRVRQIDVEPTHSPEPGTVIASRMKAHLTDGSVVVYARGASVEADTLRGDGWRYDLTLMDSSVVHAIPLDSVVGLESFSEGENHSATFAASIAPSLGGAALVTLAAAGLAAAIFGSCPTLYSDSDGVAVLEAEAFPYSVAPLFEMRVVDALRARPDTAGSLVLEVRDEALETHYLNALQVMEVRHAAGELAAPDPRGQPIVVRGLRPPARATEVGGRDLTTVLAAADGAAYRMTDADLLARSTATAAGGDWRDAVELVFDRPDADSAVIVLRLRNSLLTSVLFYDFMLDRPGARSIDWIGHDLATIGSAVELGQWYSANMGLRVDVADGDTWLPVDRIPDTGPIAWKTVAVAVPVRPGDSLRVRLSFPADGWRIDQARIATGWRRSPFRHLAPVEVLGPDRSPDAVALAAIASDDDQYLRTTPGERYWVHFDAGPAPPEERTFLAATQGYYIEWVRGAWATRAEEPGPFRPRAGTMVALLSRWSAVRNDFERDFERSRLPVR